MAKYIIELEQIKGTELFKAIGCNTLVFDKNGIEKILKPYGEEKKVDWSKVAVDTPILVRNYEEVGWTIRYFAKYEKGRVYAWDGGRTSLTSQEYNLSPNVWNYAKLAEESEKNEN